MIESALTFFSSGTFQVIQDISFSADSQWIMISSSRGTSHLFSISPFGVSDGFQYADACFSSRSSGFGMPARTPVCCPPNSGLQVFHQESTTASAFPITLSVVSRIRSGNNGWRQTVSGATAAATGRTNSLSGPIAAAFHNYTGNDSHPETSFLKSSSHLLVFSSGCLVQHVLRVSSGKDSTTALNGIGLLYESGPETDARLVVEAIRRWNISHKQNCKVREENIDIYGENGNLDSFKVFPEGIGKKKNLCSDARAIVMKDNMAFEERYQMYISEAELQMHAPRVPLWAKSKVPWFV